MLNFILGPEGGNKINRVLTVLKFAQQFSKPGKSLENGKMVKSLEFFFFKATTNL